MVSTRVIVALSVAVALQLCQVSAQSPDSVIVWVHGLFNFGGPDKAFPYKKEFKNRGFTNLIVDIGPISSNWDRACERKYYFIISVQTSSTAKYSTKSESSNVFIL
mmetsp:Transcript_14231/g.17618  ORF Transcript_14231/g.17618 Transcript_14231/m.17618 type:complete len:106 (-) Transcript_14231:28-345(-)